MLRLKSLLSAAVLTIVTTVALAQPGVNVDTTTWKSYRNESMGFATKYPASWHIRSVTGAETVVLNETPQVGKSTLAVQFWVQRQINAKGLPIDEWYKAQLPKSIATAPQISHTVIGGRPAIRSDVVGAIGRNFNFFTMLNRTDIFEVTISQPAAQTLLDQTYETILANVNFIK